VAGPTLCLTCDFDAVSVWLNWGCTGLRALGRGEFGAAVGAPRLLKLLQALGIEATWFVPGHTIDTFPSVATAVAEAGHELGHHGYLHEDFGALSRSEREEVLGRGSEAIERLTGRSPRGFRAPNGEVDAALFELLAAHGFGYDSSLFAEYQLAWCSDTDGARLDLVEIPMCLLQADFLYFELIVANPPLPAGLRNARDVEAIWRDQLDYYLRDGEGVFMLSLHPQSIGFGSRMAMLERFLRHCADLPSVRFATCETLAAEFRGAHG